MKKSFGLACIYEVTVGRANHSPCLPASMLPPSIPPSLTIVFLNSVVFLSRVVFVQLHCEHGLVYLGKDAFCMSYEKKIQENVSRVTPLVQT